MEDFNNYEPKSEQTENSVKDIKNVEHAIRLAELELKQKQLVALDEEIEDKRANRKAKEEERQANTRIKAFMSSPVFVCMLTISLSGLVNSTIEYIKTRTVLEVEQQKNKALAVIKLAEIPDDDRREKYISMLSKGGVISEDIEYKLTVRPSLDSKVFSSVYASSIANTLPTTYSLESLRVSSSIGITELTGNSPDLSLVGVRVSNLSENALLRSIRVSSNLNENLYLERVRINQGAVSVNPISTHTSIDHVLGLNDINR